MRDFEFEILGERVKVIKGVATVSITVAKELEGRGWRRGATVERDMKEGALYEGDKSRAG
jgi:hypothetical protein